MNRRAFLASLAPPLLQAQSPRRPNILLILADDLGFGELSCYGAPDARTPNLDALARGGMLFDNAYANSTVCSPTRASLLTGMYPARAGVPGVIRLSPDDSWGYLSPRVQLIPARLRDAGYRTALIGKWHLGTEPENLPNARGFESFRGMLGGMLMDYYTHQEHQGQEPDMWRDGERIRPEGHATDLFREWAIEELRRPDPRPRFLYLAFNAPHDPVQPPQEWLAKVKARQPGISEQRAKLVALIEHMDDAIGQVLRVAESSRDTMVIFTSDNGGLLNVGANNGKWRGGKGDLYEGGIRVPLIARWPGRIAAGSRSKRITLSMDLAATVAEAAGISMPAGIDGRSAFAEMTGAGAQEPPRDLYWTRREGNPRYQGKTIDAVRSGDWKLVHNSPFGPLELYNLADDPYEQRDLSATRHDKFDELARKLRLFIQESGRTPWQKP